MEINETWECYLCGVDDSFENDPKGYLANYHPLCQKCADNVIRDPNNKHRFKLTYHEMIGDIKMINNIPISIIIQS